MTSDIIQLSPPIGIGGVGGSGTRLIAEILIQSGVFLGSNLNISNDNLNFTQHFKRREWFKQLPSHVDLCAAWSLFHVEQAKQLNDSETDISAERWGWKEPNTHLFLHYLSRHITDFKYIHVMRHGLDMAFSNNQGQLRNWGPLLLGDTYDGKVTPQNSVDYWLTANSHAIETGRAMGDRFLLVKYEEFCAEPTAQIAKLLSFIGQKGDPQVLSKLVAPRSIGRRLDHDMSIFSPAQIAGVKALMELKL